jgi:hypothetical protein
MEQHAKQIHIQKSARGNEAGGDEKRIARQKKSDQEAGFGKDNRGHSEVSGPFDESRQVGEIREQLADLIHQMIMREDAR